MGEVEEIYRQSSGWGVASSGIPVQGYAACDSHGTGAGSLLGDCAVGATRPPGGAAGGSRGELTVPGWKVVGHDVG